jgi:hypothetical protein
MPVKSDVASILAEKMVRILRQRKEGGEIDSPLTLEELAKLADPEATNSEILAANLARKAFGAYALAARRDVHAPVALLEDLPQLIAGPELLMYLLSSARTASNHASSVAELKKRLTSKLQAAFQEAVQQRMGDEALPPGAGWVLIKNTKKLFLLTDLHTRRTLEKKEPEQTNDEKPATPQYSVLSTQYSVPTPRPRIDANFDTVFARLDRQSGGHNFVSLVDLRRELPLGRAAFDNELRQLRLAGRYTLSAAEGRHGLSPVEHEAGIVEDGTLLLYVSRKSP